MSIAPRSSPAALSASSVWDRWLAVWHSIFYLALIFSTGLLFIGSAFPWWEYLLIVGCTLLLGIWYGWMARRGPDYWRLRPLITLCALASGWSVWLLLSLLFPNYLLLLCGLYPQASTLLRLPWKIVASVILTLLVIGEQAFTIGGWNGLLLIPLGAGLAGILMAVFIEAIVQQSDQRRQLLEDLQAARRELANAERQAGMFEERARLAREIHDTFAQALTSLLMQLEAIEQNPSAEVRMLRQQFEQMRRTARDHLAEARRAMWALQPAILDGNSLPEVITRLAKRVSDEGHCVVKAITTGTVRTLGPEMEVTLLRAVQEALANVQKHANAHQVNITLSYLEEVVIVDIQDDGVGFEAEKQLAAPLWQTAGGYGLKALRARAEQAGGTLEIESAPGAGTTIALTLPVAASSLNACPPAQAEQEDH